MKRIFILFALAAALLVTLPAGVFAQSAESDHYAPGNVAAGIAAGGGNYYSNISFAFYPSIEVMVAHFNITRDLPLDIGLTAGGRLGLDAGFGGAGIDVGIGGYGTAHVSYHGFSGDFGDVFSRLDFFVGLGAAFDIIAPSSYQGLGFAQYSGLGYFVNDGFEIYLSDESWHHYFDGVLGVRAKFGSSKQAANAIK